MLPYFLQISEFVHIILERDNKKLETGKKPVYSKLLKCGNGVRKTALHLASERNLVAIAEVLIEYYPGQCSIKSRGEDRIPVENALEKNHDEVASLLIKSMLNERQVTGF